MLRQRVRRSGLALTGLTLCAAVALAATEVRAGTALSPTVRTTAGGIEAIAMDGPILAYDVRAQGVGCNRVRAWNVKTGRSWVVSGKGTCGADSTSTGAGVRELAVGGQRIAWVVNQGGNTESNDALFTATLPHPKEAKLAVATRKGDAGTMGTGRFLGNLVGDGSLLAVDDLRFEDDLITTAALRRVASGLPVLIDGLGAVVARAADAGRVAILGLGDTTSIWKAGTFGTSIQLPGPAREAALQDDHLAVLLTSGAILVYSAASGQLLDTIAASPKSAHLDVHSGVVVWADWRTLRAARVGAGVVTAVTTAPRRLEGVELESSGLAYAWTTSGAKEAGRVAFVPMAALQGVVP